jgi:hypothetical protein
MPEKSTKMRGGPWATPDVGIGSAPVPSMTTTNVAPLLLIEIDRIAAALGD